MSAESDHDGLSDPVSVPQSEQIDPQGATCDFQVERASLPSHDHQDTDCDYRALESNSQSPKSARRSL